jgi:hypothetical protein
VLKTVRVGQTPCTTEVWLHEFFEAIAQAKRGEGPAPIIRTPRQRQRDYEQAQERLHARGIG